MGQLTLSKLRKSFSNIEVIKTVDLDVEEGEFVVFVGPSGCGKSTLLRMIAGLEEATGGDIVISGKRVNELPPVKRGIAMVFQSYALYPHMSVFENIAFPLRVEKMNEADLNTKVNEAARVLQLDTRLKQKPGTLSGGQRQRVAIGRAIVREPKIFLFDEPLSNLDAALRAEMRIELTNLHKKLGATMIYVTHDQIEAMTMADRIVVLNFGEIAQVGSPLELYHKPANTFVASFIGNPKMNFLEVTCTGAGAAGVTVSLDGSGEAVIPVAPHEDLVGRTLTLGIRPEHVHLGSGDLELAFTPGVIERLGIHSVAYGTVGSSGENNFCGLFHGTAAIRDGRAATVGINAADCHLFDEDGQALERQIELSQADEALVDHTAA
ncbi:ABC transporter ATP-binding protein [Pelagibacterium xiamenense]|uniref:ABC transporter ATP-binding protein n=1 Tax=Pelagibacterium xiamenense TaxID=2901140 RepID=UPI001E5B190E|nr:sn-glycerol-3-phosphate ABC transporter ATP-binding protein UgpC [Pelagibacterium xiamenense]MCD7059142.1 sn-glycerol-3-phosphate ABC transporter ATP-binding protein UgpC [Pelagibacterium xiamenense]